MCACVAVVAFYLFAVIAATQKKGSTSPQRDNDSNKNSNKNNARAIKI